ncbi:SDR family oxidoreductase [Streptomyces coacervatus]|uniref:SDR family oxidoreductase n=1 Tax=Streptomyces coacervatus TaxID=647381 RepID=A0ABP7HTA9_9ACTN|nr:SDR family NAD(P)-dependent oxidoreductase [Streptomyces coacervatus]MDF2267184.1 SDR family NAD(P)-dependent oxidoreductase [Streptomyces coacervatus]
MTGRTTGEPSSQNRICLVTGASSGIGLETARGLAARGAAVGLVCRSPARGQAALRTLSEEFPAARLTLFQADLSSQTEIRRLAEDVREQLPGLNVLINNAGTIEKAHRTSPDGIELQFATNYLSLFLLTSLLAETLTANAPARVVNVASGIHGRARMDWDDLVSPRSYDAFQAYARSKFAVVAHSKSAARRLADSGVTVNSVEPGLTRTGLLDDANVGMFKVVRRFLRFAPTAAQSASHLVRLAVEPEFEGVSGLYFRKSNPAKPAKAIADPEVLQRLWAFSERLTTQPTPDREP